MRPSMSAAMNSRSVSLRNETLSAAVRPSSETSVRRNKGSPMARARSAASASGSLGISSISGRISIQSSAGTQRNEVTRTRLFTSRTSGSCAIRSLTLAQGGQVLGREDVRGLHRDHEDLVVAEVADGGAVVVLGRIARRQHRLRRGIDLEAQPGRIQPHECGERGDAHQRDQHQHEARVAHHLLRAPGGEDEAGDQQRCPCRARRAGAARGSRASTPAPDPRVDLPAWGRGILGGRRGLAARGPPTVRFAALPPRSRSGGIRCQQGQPTSSRLLQRKPLDRFLAETEGRAGTGSLKRVLGPARSHAARDRRHHRHRHLRADGRRGDRPRRPRRGRLLRDRGRRLRRGGPLLRGVRDALPDQRQRLQLRVRDARRAAWPGSSAGISCSSTRSRRARSRWAGPATSRT